MGVGCSCCQLLLIVTDVTIDGSHPVEDCENFRVGFGNRGLVMVVCWLLLLVSSLEIDRLLFSFLLQVF